MDKYKVVHWSPEPPIRPPRYILERAFEQMETLVSNVETGQPLAPAVQVTPIAAAPSPIFDGRYDPHRSRMISTIGHTVNVPSNIKGRVLYQDEFILWSPKLFVPEEAFEFTLDPSGTVKALTQLILSRAYYTNSFALLRVIGLIDIPDVVASFAPTLQIACLPATGTWYATRQCSLRISLPTPAVGLATEEVSEDDELDSMLAEYDVVGDASVDSELDPRSGVQDSLASYPKES